VTFIVSIGLLAVIPKGFFPEEDSGRILCTFQSSTDVSFPAMQQYVQEVVKVLNGDPGVANALGFMGSGKGVSTSSNLGLLYVSLRPLDVRKASADDIIARLRVKMQQLVGVTVYFQSLQDVKIGGRS
jgi:multidrug efflux pump